MNVRLQYGVAAGKDIDVSVGKGVWVNNIMKKLLKIELERALKNKWFYICLLIGFAIVAKDIYSVA